MLSAGHSLRLAVSTFLLRWDFLRVLGITKPSGKAFTYFPRTNFLCCKKAKAPNCCNQLLLFWVIFSGIGESLWTFALQGTTRHSSAILTGQWQILSVSDTTTLPACPAAPQNGGRGAPLRVCSSGIAIPSLPGATPPMAAAGGTHPCGTGPAAAASRASAHDGDPPPTRGCPPATTANTWPLCCHCISPHLQAALHCCREPPPGGNSTFLATPVL